jgi:urease accessory protein
MNNWQGSLDITFDFKDGKTWIEKSQSVAPLRIQKPFYPEGKSWVHSVLLHTAGGMVGGDRLNINLDLKPQTKVLFTSATAAKIYRCSDRCPEDIASYTTSIHQQQDSILEWFPQETILFKDSKYSQSLYIQLEQNAFCCGWDIYRFGRSARGEVFDRGEWRSRVEVWQNGIPLWIDRQYLEGNQTNLISSNALAGKSVIGTFWLIGLSVDLATMEDLRSVLSESKISFSEVGITQLEKGILCRYRGNSTVIARQLFTSIWGILREKYGDRPQCIPRVWQI